jgi:hypothetical protein
MGTIIAGTFFSWYHDGMKNKQEGGFVMVLVVVVIAFAAFAYFYKDASGMSYYDKLMGIITNGKKEVNQKVDGMKDTLKTRDAQIKANF